MVINGTAATTTAPTKQPTGTAARTMLMLGPNVPIEVVEWGCSFDASAAAVPGEIELIDTLTVFVNTISTAFVVGDVMPYNDPAAPANSAGTTGTPLGIGASLSGFASANPTGEGTIAAPIRYGDFQLVAPTGQYVKQMPLGERFKVPAGHCLRIRMTFAVTVNTYCYVIFSV
jgi:hypothetical protein